MTIQYRYPRLYDVLISLWHSKGLLERFKTEVGQNHTVFEIGAGYGRVARSIDSSNIYYGIDLNSHLVNYGRKRGVNLEIKDIFDPTAYRESDIFIVVDVIHHLKEEKLKILFDLIFSHTRKKIVILEPSIIESYGVFGKLIEWISRIFDQDGINKIERLLTNEEYKRLFEDRFGSLYGKKFDLQYQLVGGRCLYQLVTYTHV